MKAGTIVRRNSDGMLGMIVFPCRILVSVNRFVRVAWANDPSCHLILVDEITPVMMGSLVRHIDGRIGQLVFCETEFVDEILVHSCVKVTWTESSVSESLGLELLVNLSLLLGGVAVL